ncbi:2-C-methyl-D-erythritol 4-phosphate cytidylyltransferase [Alkalihalobacterium chitinilyticum]|uniref:2-C-methyl-D-erythritol 4-phosphate cytidylyltransferase n=1 Tax=Alkalihalobacterium chitinilyticum TaxID=2980103 RepID=A0ABT5VJZ3_9BACI|nr:2-C-methyl-D-erythritol 4-phosphate cytidylyltransferase [Alkalihalobacterium chitinilyticum]MDE5415734.1 2-C-methyl-D-erythritol 4-phosphate cytidylyltransferase [Alkalihalobacterium chitinilyticum]
MNYSVVIPAAGQGKRMKAGQNKQFLQLSSIPLIIHTLLVFEKDPWCREIILVTNQEEKEVMKNLVHDFNLQKVNDYVMGGSERQYSVANGLDAIKDETIVLIHDGARPFIEQAKIHELVLCANETGAAVIAVPVKDTIKKVTESKVETTMERSSLWAVQTPQAFRLSLIKKAHELAKQQSFLGTDDASLVENMNEVVAIVEGDYLNMKLTTPEDLLFAEAILASRKGKE